MTQPKCIGIAVVLALTISSVASGQLQLWSFAGDAPSDQLGYSVHSAGDVDGDGFDDVISGARNASMARVYSGKTGATLYTFFGDAIDDEFGRAVAGAGDVNSDGFDDVVVGAPFDDDNGSQCGSARVFSGLDGSILYTFYGDMAGDELGHSVDGIGDVTNDGFDDVLVGIRNADTNGMNSGTVRVYSGLTGLIVHSLHGDSAGDALGYSVSGGDDVNGDGVPDFIAGAPFDDNTASDSGSARVFSGVDGAILHTFNGDSSADSLGFTVGAAHDVDNDGFGDIVAGSPYDDDTSSNAGSTRVFSGQTGTVLYTFYGDTLAQQLGTVVAGPGDVNQDGFADILAASFADDTIGTNSGIVRIFSGIDGSTLYTIFGANPVDVFGWSAAGAGDVNGDGYPDIIVGSPFKDDNGSASGSAEVISFNCGTVAHYGMGCAGSGGFVPTLDLDGCAAPGGSIEIAVAQGDGGSFVLFVVGLGQAMVPYGGGCFLLVGPTVIPTIAVPLNGLGAGMGTLNIPVTLPANFAGSVTLQALLQDSSVPPGFTSSNGIQFTVN